MLISLLGASMIQLLQNKNKNHVLTSAPHNYLVICLVIDMFIHLAGGDPGGVDWVASHPPLESVEFKPETRK